MRDIFRRGLRMMLAAALACMMMCGQAALAEAKQDAAVSDVQGNALGGGLSIAAQLPEGTERTAKSYQAKHRLLGVSSRDHSAMIEINGDYCGWLEQEGTPIDYPIAQGEDNDLYMDHSFELEKRRAGCLFLDWRNGEFYRDANSIVYGHHMKDDSMLATIVGYEAQQYYDEHPTMKLYTPYGDYIIEVFSGTIVSGERDFLERSFDSDPAFDEYFDIFLKDSTFECGVDIARGDHIISLVTCTYEYNNARYIVCGKLVPMDVWEE